MTREEVIARETLKAEIELAGEWLSDLNDGEFSFDCCSLLTANDVFYEALNSGTSLVIRTFGERLAAFKFPSHIAKKLQGFVDYNT